MSSKEPKTIKPDRRRFLKEGAALAGLAVGAIRSGSAQTLGSEIPEARPRDRGAYGERSRFVNSVRIKGVWGRQTPLQDSVGTITPAPLHYVAMHGYDPPDIDPRQHRLLIHGMVDRPLIFTLEELMLLPSVSRPYFLHCGPGNPRGQTVQETHGWTSCSEWTGVPLSVLLQEVGVKTGASWLIAEGADTGKHSKSIPLNKVMDDVLVAYGQNGEPVRPEQGYPFRLIVPGWQGVNNVKWLRRIKLVDEPYMSHWESAAYSNLMRDGKARWVQFEMEPKSVITRPSGGHQLPGPGFCEITGLAWSGWGAIRRVEVSTDGGRTWKDAQLQGPVHPKAHTRFHFPWYWDGQETLIASRCTDERGGIQPSVADFGEIGTAEDVVHKAARDNLELAGRNFNFNPIFSWKVTREGRVQNAML